MRRFLIAFCILLFFVPGYTYAQVTFVLFSEQPEKFCTEMVAYLNETRLDDALTAAKEFKTAWPAMDPYFKEDIIAMSNIMLKRRMETNPYFIAFIRTINTINAKKISPDIISDWSKMVKPIMQNAKPSDNLNILSFINFSQGLFSDQAVYSSNSHTWKSSSDNYKLKTDNANEPYVEFSDIDLLGITQGDTARIDGTSGTYYPLTKRWKGKNGFVTWERAGLDSSFANVHLGNYRMDMSKNEYSVDSVKLHYEPMNGKNLFGRFTDKIVKDNNPKNTIYPKFESYRYDFVLDNIDKRVKIYSGLRLEGGHMYATGDKEHKVVVKIYKEDGHTLAASSRSRSFLVKKFEEIISEDAETSIYFAKDSIYHNGAKFDYKISKHELTLTRQGNGDGKSPFYSSYHKSEIVTEELLWNIDEDEIYMKNITAAATQVSTLTSESQYDENTFYKYQTTNEVLPISIIKLLCDESHTRELPLGDVAKRLNKNYSEETIIRLIYKLVEDGFVNYDPETKIVHVRQKVFNYAMSPYHKFDYDIIKVKSKTDSTNFTLNLKNLEFKGKGVYQVPLSDSNFVMFFPAEKNMTMGKNRDMKFSGTVFAGRADFLAEGANFSYNTFDIDINKIKTYQINIPTGGINKDGSEEVVPIRSKISDLKGLVKIDDPRNKSHAFSMPEYPKLIATEGGRIYYDDKRIAKGAYNRDKFYFELVPFEMDSLNKFHSSRVHFDGKLVSGGILPDVENTVRIQKDYTLGFTAVLPELSAYGGRGTFSDTMTLDGRGLTAKGKIKFLNTTISSHKINMYLDSMRAPVETFEAEATTINGAEFPKVSSRNNNVLWKPYNDSMLVEMTNTPFKLFDAETYLRGNIVLTSKGMRGSGTVDWVDARLQSRDIEFKRNGMNADSSSFMIKAGDSTKFALRTVNVSSQIDFDKRKGYFKSRSETINTEFPYNLYKTSMDEFTWDMDNKFVDFRSINGSSVFTSVHPDQDSLNFEGAHAIYNLRNYLLEISGVPKINVADGAVIPDSGIVRIEPNAHMRTLFHAKIECDTINNFHKLYDVRADITAKNSLQGTGWLDFESADKRKEKIFMNDIHVERIPQEHKSSLIAFGEVPDTANFTLMTKLRFKGKTIMHSGKENLRFSGFAKLELKYPNAPTRWFAIDDEFNQDSSYLNFKRTYSEDKKRVDVGIFFDHINRKMYTCLFDIVKDDGDRSVVDLKGVVYYDETDKLYKFGNPKKILDNALRGNVLTYDDATGNVIAEGKVDFQLKTNMFHVDMGGKITTTVGKPAYIANVAMGIKFPFPKELEDKIAKDINTLSADKDEIDNSDDATQRAVIELVDTTREKRFMDNFGKNYQLKKSNDLDYTLFFSQLQFEYDSAGHSFHCKGPLGLSFFGDKIINKKLDGYAETIYKYGNDEVRLYFKLSDDDWYYIEYVNNNLNLLSSSDEFNKLLTGLKSSKKSFKSDDNKLRLNIQASTEKKVKNFVAKMKRYEEEALENKKAPADKDKKPATDDKKDNDKPKK